MWGTTTIVTPDLYARAYIDYWVINYSDWRVNLIDQINTQIIMQTCSLAERSSNRNPANYFSAYVYASHFILIAI